MNKIFSSIMSVSLVTIPLNLNSAEIAKSAQKDNQQTPKPKNIDKVYGGEEGTLNESKSALISPDSLALQNYSSIKDNFDFSTYDNVPLKSVILETLSQSNDLKSANEKVIQTDLQYKDAFSGYLPTVDFQYSAKTIHNSRNGDDNVDKDSHRNFNEESYKFTLKQSLYTGGATESKIKSLKSKLEEAKRKYTIVLEQEIQKAIKAYFDVLFSKQSVVVNERNMEKLNKILEITQVKYDSGALSIGDLSAVKANIANASGKLIKVKSDLADAIDFYIYTVGEDFAKTAPYEENFNLNLTTLEDLYVDIVENNLGLMNYRLNIQSTKDKLLNMKATFKPKVDFEMNYKNVLDKEDFKANEETYDAKLTLNYNLYNGGKDTIATMEVFSSLQELNFRYLEEVKKLKWTMSKLFNSIKSLEDTMGTTKREVAASKQMVESYWEGFQLGEQDLQVLLQGQRQLNGVELDLIRYKQDHLTNIFKLLSEKGELSKYFEIDSDNPDFIDFTNTATIKPNIKLDLTSKSDENITLKDNNTTDNNSSKDLNTTVSNELNVTVDKFLEVVNESSFKDIINFKDRFLEASDENVTIIIGDFTNHYDAYSYMDKNRILDKAFSYEVLNKNNGEQNDSKTKIIDVKTNIASGIYSTKEEAEVDLKSIFDKTGKNFKIVTIKDVKNLYNDYVDGLEAKIEPIIIAPVKQKVIKTFMTNQEMKTRFLSAPSSSFSINVVSVSQISKAEALIKAEKIEPDSFVFKYGRNGEWVKVMLGVFDTYEEATNELNKHPELIKKYSPVVEKIGQKQDLYNKYSNLNPIPQWFLDEQKEKKELFNVKDKKDKQVKKDKKEKLTKIEQKIEPKQKQASEVIELPDIKNETQEKEPNSQLINKVQNEPIFEQLEIAVQEVTVQNELQTDNTLSLAQKHNESNSNDPILFEEVKSEIEQPTTTKLENESKSEQNKTINQSPNKEISSQIDTSVTVESLKSSYKTFKEAYDNAPKHKYTLELPPVLSKDKDAFIKRYLLSDNFTEITKKGYTRIFFELFDDVEKARAQKFNMHPQLVEKIKVMRLERITK